MIHWPNGTTTPLCPDQSRNTSLLILLRIDSATYNFHWLWASISELNWVNRPSRANYFGFRTVCVKNLPHEPVLLAFSKFSIFLLKNAFLALKSSSQRFSAFEYIQQRWQICWPQHASPRNIRWPVLACGQSHRRRLPWLSMFSAHPPCTSLQMRLRCGSGQSPIKCVKLGVKERFLWKRGSCIIAIKPRAWAIFICS